MSSGPLEMPPFLAESPAIMASFANPNLELDSIKPKITGSFEKMMVPLRGPPFLRRLRLPLRLRFSNHFPIGSNSNGPSRINNLSGSNHYHPTGSNNPSSSDKNNRATRTNNRGNSDHNNRRSRTNNLFALPRRRSLSREMLILLYLTSILTVRVYLIRPPPLELIILAHLVHPLNITHHYPLDLHRPDHRRSLFQGMLILPYWTSIPSASPLELIILAHLVHPLDIIPPYPLNLPHPYQRRSLCQRMPTLLWRKRTPTV